MTRDPDLDQAVVDLRDTFADLRRAKAQLGHDDVRSDLNNRSAVQAIIRDSREHIAVRAGRLAVHPDALTVILSAHSRERQRLKRAPSVRQVTAALRTERTAAAERVARAHDAAARAQNEVVAALRADVAVEGACLAYTGYPS